MLTHLRFRRKRNENEKNCLYLYRRHLEEIFFLTTSNK